MTTDNVSDVRSASVPVRTDNGAPDGQKASDPERYVPIAGPRRIVNLDRDTSHGAHCYDGDLTLICGWPEFHRAGGHL
jgi:hypothetical protein